jgi:serine/threonine-protein kinase OSR1/STK39
MASLAGGGSQWSTTFSDYALFEKVGRGAFGDVFRAGLAGVAATDADRVVALNVLDLEKIGSEIDDVTRAEVLTMKSCKHPNVLGCFACFTSPSDSNLYLVMPYMDRGSALHVMKTLKREGKRAAGLDRKWVQYILGEVLQGMRYLHDNKLIHRDIKAGNILLNGRGEVMISDFGQTTFMQECGKDRQHATFTGTVCWMAPEVMAQEEGYPYSYPADVWSIGITALELAKGYAPYAMFAPMKVLLETLQQSPPTIKSYVDEQNSKQPRVSGTEWAHKSSAFKKFVAACLKRDPSERSNVAALAGMKFVSHGKAGAQEARAMFARELCSEIRNPIHFGKEGGEAKAIGAAKPGAGNKPEWDFSDILGVGEEGGGVAGGAAAAALTPAAAPTPAAAVDKNTEVNDDNFGDMFSAAGLGGL